MASTFLMIFLSLLLFYGDWLHVDSISCSSRNTHCPNNGLCDPNTFQCVNQSETIACGKWGDFLDCGTSGIVFGECGSGFRADCESSLCPDKNKGYEAIECNYPGLEPAMKQFNTTKWLCGGDGTHLSCFENEGSVLVGVCGSGGHEDCKDECKGYHGILCAKSNYFDIDFTRCSWATAGYGEWAYCKEGTVATGHCGSGRKAECGRKDWHALQCCRINY